MTVCRNCGAQNAAGGLACGTCGISLQDPTGPEAGRGSQPPGGSQPAGGYSTGGWTTPPDAPTARIPTEPSTRRGTYTAPIASASQSRPGLIRCTTCNTANPPSRGFCQKCGSRLAFGDPLEAGVASRMGLEGGGRDLGRVLVMGGALGLGAVLLGAALFFGGFLGGRSPAATRSPAASPIAGASPPASGASASGSPSIGPSPSGPGETSPGPSGSPRPRFTCAATTINAKTPVTWTLGRATWDSGTRADRLTILMSRTDEAGASPGSLTVEVVELDALAARRLDAPADGERALLLTFTKPVRLTSPLAAETDMQSLREFDIRMRRGRPIGILGVDGEGCFNVSAPAWAAADPPADGEIVVAIRNP